MTSLADHHYTNHGTHVYHVIIVFNTESSLAAMQKYQFTEPSFFNNNAVSRYKREDLPRATLASTNRIIYRRSC